MTPIEPDRRMLRPRIPLLAARLVLASTVAAAACGGDNHQQPDAAVADASADAAPPPPAVLLTERVLAPGNNLLYYVSILPDVPTAPVDRSMAMELTSADVEIYNDRVYIRDRFANTMTRYRVSAERKLVEDGRFSFAGVGLGTGRYSNAYVSPERAYALDAGGWRLIGWNPTTMALTGEIVSISYMKKDDPLVGAISPPVVVGDRLISAVSWEDFTNRVIYPGSGALVIDPAASGPPVFIEDARVGGAFRITADGGDAYMTGVTGGDVRLFGHALGNGPLPASGLVRLPAGQGAFDPSYLVDIEAITGTKGVWAVHRIDAGTLLAQILDPQVAPPATLPAYNASQEFMFVIIDVVHKTFAPVASLPKGGVSNAGNHVVDGKLYIQLRTATGSAAYAVSASGVTAAFTVPGGDVWHLQRIR